VLNFDLLEALVAHVVAAEAAQGPDALLQARRLPPGLCTSVFLLASRAQAES